MVEHAYWVAKTGAFHGSFEGDPWRDYLAELWLTFGVWDEDDRGLYDGVSIWFDDDGLMWSTVVVHNVSHPVVLMEGKQLSTRGGMADSPA